MYVGPGLVGLGHAAGASEFEVGMFGVLRAGGRARRGSVSVVAVMMFAGLGPALGLAGPSVATPSPQGAEARSLVGSPQRPIVRRLSPAKGTVLGGTRVRIRGGHFTRRSVVLFDGVRANRVYRSPTLLIARAPLASRVGTADVRVRTGRRISPRVRAARYRYTPGIRSVDLVPGQSMVVKATPELAIEVPAGAVGGGSATLTFTPRPGLASALDPSMPLESFADVTLSSGEPNEALQFRWKFARPLAPGERAAFYGGDPTAEAFTPIRTTIAQDRRSATAEVSLLGPIGFDWFDLDNYSNLAGRLLSTRTDRPTCEGEPPGWVEETDFVDELQSVENPMLVCVGRDPNDSELFVVKIANNRGHGLLLNVPVPWEWIHFSDVGGLGSHMEALLGWIGRSGPLQVPLVPGQEVHLAFAYDTAVEHAIDNQFAIDGAVNGAAIGLGIVNWAIDQAFGSVTGVPIVAAVALAKCFDDDLWGERATLEEALTLIAAKSNCLANVNAWATLVHEVLGDDFYEKFPFADATKISRLLKRFNFLVTLVVAAQGSLEIGASFLAAPQTFDVTTFIDPNYDPTADDPERTVISEAGFSASLNGNGRFVAYASANAEVRGDTNGVQDVFVRDRYRGTTTRVSVGPGGDEAYLPSGNPSISADGRYVAYNSDATNLVPNDTNGETDVFFWDRTTGVTRRVSVGSGGTQADGRSSSAYISADGRFVAFVSAATNLVASDTNDVEDTYVHDLATGLTTREPLTSEGDQMVNHVGVTSISGTGRYLTMQVFGSDLPPGAGNCRIYLRDRVAGSMELIPLAVEAQTNPWSCMAMVSADGRYVAYTARVTDADQCWTCGSNEVYVWHRETGDTVRLTRPDLDAPATGSSDRPPLISGNGDFVAFESSASDLDGDDNHMPDIFRWSRADGSITHVNDGDAGSEPAMSADGLKITYQSIDGLVLWRDFG